MHFNEEFQFCKQNALKRVREDKELLFHLGGSEVKELIHLIGHAGYGLRDDFDESLNQYRASAKLLVSEVWDEVQ